MKQRKRRLSFLLALSVLLLSSTPLPVRADQEQQIGQQVYSELNRKGEIISSSPLYDTLEPIAARIKRIADPQYQYPFHFILVHEKDPNAFAVPGGNVYVTDSLMSFVQNREELAGVLCHETSHDIHHDVINNMRKDQNLQIGATILSLLLGRAAGGLAGSAINLLANVQAQSYSRAVETGRRCERLRHLRRGRLQPMGHGVAVPEVQQARRGHVRDALRPPARRPPHRRSREPLPRLSVPLLPLLLQHRDGDAAAACENDDGAGSRFQTYGRRGSSSCGYLSDKQESENVALVLRNFS
jgi:hypothetical protein